MRFEFFIFQFSALCAVYILNDMCKINCMLTWCAVADADCIIRFPSSNHTPFSMIRIPNLPYALCVYVENTYVHVEYVFT